ncbi:DUF4852 domain-containing protein [Treponema sp. OttesenSCG-928-L16]|nr:DUF4852 domain-containing protein [Treponema sp. OttesenSCG-928-L16]
MKRFLGMILLFGLIGVGNAFSQEVIGLSYEHMFYMYFNGTKKTPTDEEVNAFIENVHPAEYSSFRRNEFEWRKLKQAGIEELNNGIANFNPETFFVVISDASFGEYDFEKEGFNFTISNNFIFNTRFDGSFVRFNLLLTNNHDFNLMKMDPDTANEMIKSRTGISKVDRGVRLYIYFKFADFSQEVFTSLVGRQSGYFLHGTIERIEVLDSHTRGQVYDTSPYFKIGEVTSE